MKVGVLGATGAVGRVLLSLLEERKFPLSELVPFGSTRSEGKVISFAGKSYTCHAPTLENIRGLDVVFVDVPDEVALEWVPKFSDQGAWVIDNSAAFRTHPEALLCIPEVNGDQLVQRLTQPKKGLNRVLANPNCSTAQMVMVLKAIQSRFGLTRVVVSTYQSTSGAGAGAMDELTDQVHAILHGEQPPPAKFLPHQIAFDCIPQVGSFQKDLYTSEEHKMISETRTLLNEPNLKVTPTCVRVPTWSCHAESLSIECQKDFEISDVVQALKEFPGVEVVDDPSKKRYPMSRIATGKDPVFVGRIRKDLFQPKSLNLWIVADNLRKGAALNAVQLGEALVREKRAFD